MLSFVLGDLLIKMCHCQNRTGNLRDLADLRVALPKRASAHTTIAREFQRAGAWHPSKGKLFLASFHLLGLAFEQTGFGPSARASDLAQGCMICAAIGLLSSDPAFLCTSVTTAELRPVQAPLPLVRGVARHRSREWGKGTSVL